MRLPTTGVGSAMAVVLGVSRQRVAQIRARRDGRCVSCFTPTSGTKCKACNRKSYECRKRRLAIKLLAGKA